MKEWIEYIKRADKELTVLPEEFLEQIGGKTEIDMAALLENPYGAKDLPAEHLRKLLTLFRSWKRWQKAVASTRSRLQFAAKLWTTNPAQVNALVRVVRLLSMGDKSPGQEAWVEGLKIWDGAVGVARKSATIHIEAKDTEHPRFEHYADLIGRQESLEEFRSHRWLAARRGEEEGVLSITFTLPIKEMEQQVALHRIGLGEALQERSNESLLQELVLDDIEPWLRFCADQDAQQAAFTLAAQNYKALLESSIPPVQTLAAVYIGNNKSKIGLAWMNGLGELQGSESFPADDSSIDDVIQALQERPVEAIAIPLRAAAAQRVRILHQALLDQDAFETEIHKVRTSGISAARDQVIKKNKSLSREVAAALVLGCRLVKPFEEWSRVDPLTLGLAEYQDLLDAKLLRQALKDERALLRYQNEKHPKPPTTNWRPTLPSSQRNSNLKTLKDLKEGMILDGVVANLTEFGAFVHFGLPQEGLVHLSELADRFVRHPSEVVQIGQKVQVRVLSVDFANQRIALSMRDPNKPRPRSKNQRKAQALKDLEALFKK